MTGPGSLTCELPAWLLYLPDWIWPFVIPDHCEGSPDVWLWLTILFAHLGLGGAIGLLPRWIALGVLASWGAKELGADIPIGEWSGVVMLDSLIDLGAGILGFAFTTGRVRNDR